MRRRRTGSSSSGEDYGPVTDLVFSMFAVSVLLIGILGTDGQVKQQELDKLVGMEGVRKELQPMLNAPASNAMVPLSVADSLAAERDAARHEAERQRRAADEAAERTADLTAELGKLRSLAAFRLDLGTLAIHIDSAAMSGGPIEPAFFESIRILVAAHAGDIRTVGANRLTFEINVAAHLGEASRDGDRDYLSSLSIALALDEAFRRTPLPFNCLAAVPLGKSRSSAVAALAAGDRPGESLDRFDALGAADLPATAAKLRELAPEDSRLRVVAETVTADSCDPGRLADAIDRWAATGR